MRFFGPSPDGFDGTGRGHGYRTRPAYYRAYHWHCKGKPRKAQGEAPDAAAEAYTKAELDECFGRNLDLENHPGADQTHSFYRPITVVPL